jgi:metallo-beta-lactamase family protein
MASLTFLGAAGTVTGSKHLLDAGGHRILVDCGLFQGLKALRERNWHPFPVPADSIEAIVLTHAHLDHCGYLPRLVSQGFKGRVFCTGGTRDLATLVLPDSAKIQEEDAREANRQGYSKHHPALPLYTSEDAERALTHLQPVGYDRPIPIAPGMEVRFINAGHLLGSAYAEIRVDGKTLLFGGDLGRYGRPVLPDPAPVDHADIVLVESTYGDRLHPTDDGGARLAAIVKTTIARGGKVIIPAFAIGRVEEVLYWLKQLEDSGRIPVVPVFVDSPMASKGLAFYKQRGDELDPDMSDGMRKVFGFSTRRLTMVASAQQSIELVASRQPAIVIASSGMATGGRVLHHLEATLPHEKHTVLFVGFQAQGTRGRRLLDGERTSRMKGREVLVRATIEHLDSMSAHADQSEVLRWLSGFKTPPKRTFLVHGEPGPLSALQLKVNEMPGWNAHIPAHQERVEF